MMRRLAPRKCCVPAPAPDELYLAGLCRLPSEAERTAANNHLAQREDKAAAFEDICWAMLNTDEFLFQH